MFRFSIRDVLWLTVVVALGVGWVIDRAQSAKDRRALSLYQEQIQTELERTKRELSIQRFRALRESELRGKVILPSGPVR
jgi:uncharacterized membrane-anchored protein YhcB (DUF1043 family)